VHNERPASDLGNEQIALEINHTNNLGDTLVRVVSIQSQSLAWVHVALLDGRVKGDHETAVTQTATKLAAWQRCSHVFESYRRLLVAQSNCAVPTSRENPRQGQACGGS
jgi:hypothetical protein